MPLAQVVQAVQACATGHFELDGMPKLGEGGLQEVVAGGSPQKKSCMSPRA
jgi:hypothetical protein